MNDKAKIEHQQSGTFKRTVHHANGEAIRIAAAFARAIDAPSKRKAYRNIRKLIQDEAAGSPKMELPYRLAIIAMSAAIIEMPRAQALDLRNFAMGEIYTISTGIQINLLLDAPEEIGHA